jgi:hypothetical protein
LAYYEFVARVKKPPVSPEENAVPAVPAVPGRIIERPDGYYWQEKEGGEEYGPFPTRAEAEADMESDGVAATDPDAVHDAESELGISEWIDPDSGEPAEDSVPRIEDH